MTEMMDLYGVGDHGGGPTRAILDEGFHWAGTPGDPKQVMPKMEFGIAQTFFSTWKSRSLPNSPEWNYALDCEGVQAPPAGCRGQGCDSDVEERDVL